MKHIVIKTAILSIYASLISIGASAQPDSCGKRYAVTGFSVNFLREKPDFPQELGNQLLMGTPVEITGEESYWRQVVSPDPYKAWCVEKGLVEMTADEIAGYIAAPKYIVTAEYSHVYSEPSAASERISDLVMGCLLRIPALQDKRQEERRQAAGMDTPECRSMKFTKAVLPSGAAGYVPAEDVEDFTDWAAAAKATPENIVNTARLFLGVPYMWGGTSVKGVDCSGLTRMVWFMNGVLIPRNASQQAKAGIEVPLGHHADRIPAEDALKTGGMDFSISALQPGDLIFFGKDGKVSHVGIYIGDGKFIHASQKVRINSLIPSDPDCYEHISRLMSARRLTGQEGKGNGVTRILDSPAYFLHQLP